MAPQPSTQPHAYVLAEARRRAALADQRDRDAREASTRGMLPNIDWLILLRDDQ